MLTAKKYAIALILLSLVLLISISFSTDKSKTAYTIGVMQFSEAQSLIDAYNGFIDGLAEAGYIDGDNINIIYRTASGDASNSAAIADYLVNYNCDLIYSLSTISTLAIKEKTSTIPVVMCPIIDPAYAGIIPSNERPGGNMTGMSDFNPISGQIKLMRRLIPEVKTVGILYTSSDFGAQVQSELVMKELEQAGIKYINSPITQIDEIRSAIDALSNKIEILYLPPDMTMSNSAALVSRAAIDAGLPTVSSYGMVHGGALANFGPDCYELGKEAAKIALRILVDGEYPGDIPIGYQAEETMRTIINETTAKALGFDVPEELLKNAIIIN